MDDDQRSDFLRRKREALKDSRRGHSYQYPNNEEQLRLDGLGYKHHIFESGRDYSDIELEAKEAVIDYRSKGYHSRIVCYANEIIGLKSFSVIYRKKGSAKP